ncbi:MAG: MFS transporter [Gaiellaceae bacterium]
MTSVENERVRYRDALAFGEFRAVFAAFSISLLGSVVAAVALTVLVYERTGSPFLSSLTFALGFLPYIVSGLLLSAVVDRLPPRRLLTGSDTACALLVVVMAWPRMPIPVLLGVLLLVSTVTSISGGARNALLRAVVGDAAFVPARSLMRIAAQTAQIVGNGLGGALLVVLAPRDLILLNAASFAGSAALTRFGLRHRPAREVASRVPLLRDSLRGARAVLARVELRRLLLFGWLVPACTVAPEALAAPYVFGSGGSRVLVGIWLVALPAGIVCGDLLGVWRLSPSRQRRLVVPLAAFTLLPYLAFLVRPPVPLALALLALSGLGGAYALGLDALVRDTAPRPLFARTMAINSAGLMTVQGLGFTAAGAVAELLAPAYVIAAAGACGLVAIALLRPARSSRAAETLARGAHAPGP